jgi:hypothetical protein
MRLEITCFVGVKFINSSYFNIITVSKIKYFKSIRNELMLYVR